MHPLPRSPWRKRWRVSHQDSQNIIKLHSCIPIVHRRKHHTKLEELCLLVLVFLQSTFIDWCGALDRFSLQDYSGYDKDNYMNCSFIWFCSWWSGRTFMGLRGWTLILWSSAGWSFVGRPGIASWLRRCPDLCSACRYLSGQMLFFSGVRGFRRGWAWFGSCLRTCSFWPMLNRVTDWSWYRSLPRRKNTWRMSWAHRSWNRMMSRFGARIS